MTRSALPLRESLVLYFVTMYESDVLPAELRDGINAAADRFSRHVESWWTDEVDQLADIFRDLALGPGGPEGAYLDELDRATNGGWFAGDDNGRDFAQFARRVAINLDAWLERRAK